MIWFYLSISKYFCRIGNYFYNLHVKELRINNIKKAKNLTNLTVKNVF